MDSVLREVSRHLTISVTEEGGWWRQLQAYIDGCQIQGKLTHFGRF